MLRRKGDIGKSGTGVGSEGLGLLAVGTSRSLRDRARPALSPYGGEREPRTPIRPICRGGGVECVEGPERPVHGAGVALEEPRATRSALAAEASLNARVSAAFRERMVRFLQGEEDMPFDVDSGTPGFGAAA